MSFDKLRMPFDRLRMNAMNAMNSFWVSRHNFCFVCDFGYKTKIYIGKWAFLHSFAFIAFILTPYKRLFNEQDEYRCTFMLFKAFFCNALIGEGFRGSLMNFAILRSSLKMKKVHFEIGGVA